MRRWSVSGRCSESQSRVSSPSSGCRTVLELLRRSAARASSQRATKRGLPARSFREQPAQALVVGVPGDDRTQRGHGLDRGPLVLLRAVGDATPVTEEALPHHVPSGPRPGGEVTQEGGGHGVPRQDVALGVEHDGRQVGQPLEHPQGPGPHHPVDPTGPGRRRPGEVEELVPLVVTQTEGAGEGSQDGGGRLGPPPCSSRTT